MNLAAPLLAATLVLAACGGRPAPAPQEAPPGEAPSESAPTLEALPRASITLYFPSASEDKLVAETREIFDTARPTERGTQVLVALLDGPTGEGLLPAVPEGTTLRQLWIGKEGIAWADFSKELSNLSGGSAEELAAVYAIVDSVTANVPSIRRVGILVEGRERDTLAGHVDIRRPLPPDKAAAQAPAEGE